jgi:hypothetical protein
MRRAGTKKATSSSFSNRLTGSMSVLSGNSIPRIARTRKKAAFSTRADLEFSWIPSRPTFTNHQFQLAGCR